MGKYAPPEHEDFQWSIDTTMKLRIANELAEANRLKRLELKGMRVNWCGDIILDKELKDQA